MYISDFVFFVDSIAVQQTPTHVNLVTEVDFFLAIYICFFLFNEGGRFREDFPENARFCLIMSLL